MKSSRLLLPASVLVLMLLRIHVSLANTMWFHTGSDKKIPPVTNFKLSLRGYDVLLADPWQAEDPGFGDQIFEPFYTQNGRTYFYSFINEVEINTECDSKFTFSHISNSTEYLNEKFSDYSFFLGAFNNENNESVFSDESHRSGLPKQWHQEMVIGRAKCLTHRVQIAPFEKPVFTENFRNALRVLHEAAKDPMSVRSRETMMMFFLTFGTHFMKTVELGSKVVMWKTVSGQERSLDLKCLENSIDETVKKSNGNTASANSNFRTHSSQCDMKDGNEIPTSAEVDNGADMLITGIFPNKTMDTWNQIAKASPRPIGAELVKISYFFRDQWMDFIGQNTTTTLNTEAMYELYEIGLSYYCDKILKKNCKTSTLEELKNVANTRAAIAAGTNELRFQSDQPHGTAMLLQEKPRVFNTVILSGGFKGINEALGSVEVLSHNVSLSLKLPDLPVKVGGHSLSMVGSLLVNCGGSTPWQLSDSLFQCYELNIESPNASWSPSFKLPGDMKTFHTAISMDSSIWFFDRGSFTVYVYELQSKTFTQYFLPFLTTSEMCITKLEATVIAVDTEKNTIYILKDPSDPLDWQAIHTNLITRYSPTCTAIGSLVYITGDARNEVGQDFEVYDAERQEVHLIAHFSQPRIGYGLFALDGKPVAVGGMVRTGKIILTSAEVYDDIQGEWLTIEEQLLSPRTLFAWASASL